MKVLVTGASSYVGARIYTDLQRKHDVIGTYHSNRLFPELRKLDITREGSVNQLIQEIEPEWIIHVAANPSNAWCEKNPELAKRINVDGTKHVVAAANSLHCKLIHMSSVAAIEPGNLYGETKKDAEEYAKTAKNGYVILRPSLIVGYSPNTTNDRPFNRLLRNLQGEPAVYDTSWRFQPTWLRHISEIVQLAIERDLEGETIPISVPELTTRYDLAKDILTLFDVEVEPVDKHDASPTIVETLGELERLRLPQYSYEEMIDGIVREIEEKRSELSF